MSERETGSAGCARARGRRAHGSKLWALAHLDAKRMSTSRGTQGGKCHPGAVQRPRRPPRGPHPAHLKRARPGQTRAVNGTVANGDAAPLAASGKRKRGFDVSGSPLSSGAPAAASRWSGGIGADDTLASAGKMFSASDGVLGGGARALRLRPMAASGPAGHFWAHTATLTFGGRRHVP